MNRYVLEAPIVGAADYTGIVIADGHGAYDAPARAGPGFTLAHCWAHVRRKLIGAEPPYPAPCRSVLDLVGQLYAVQREAPLLPAMGGETEVMREELLAQRRRCATSPGGSDYPTRLR